MSVRRSSISDALDVLRLVEEYYDGVSVMARDSRETLMAYLTNADCGVWLAYCDATPVGCILYHPIPDMERTGEVKRLYGDSLHTECLERREQLRHLMSTTRRPARRLRRPDRPCVRCRVSRFSGASPVTSTAGASTPDRPRANRGPLMVVVAKPRISDFEWFSTDSRGPVDRFAGRLPKLVARRRSPRHWATSRPGCAGIAARVPRFTSLIKLRERVGF